MKIIILLMISLLFSCSIKKEKIHVKIIYIWKYEDYEKGKTLRTPYPYTTFERIKTKVRFTIVTPHIYGKVGEKIYIITNEHKHWKGEVK